MTSIFNRSGFDSFFNFFSWTDIHDVSFVILFKDSEPVLPETHVVILILEILHL